MEDWTYPIRFVDEIQDWSFILHTTEEKSDEEIISLVEYWAEVNNRNLEHYSPVDIMDDIVESHPGWSWDDGIDDIVIRNW